MLHFTKAQIALIFAVALATLFFCLPNFPVMKPIVEQGPSWWRPMTLGLDLRGGTSLLLEVDTTAILKSLIADVEGTVQGGLREAKLTSRTRGIRPVEDGLIVQLAEPAAATAVRAEILKVAPTGVIVEPQGEDRLKVSIPEKMRRDRQIAAIAQSVAIVSRRIDPTGTSEASVQPQGAERILVELPGVDDPERIKKLLVSTAKMDFKLLEPNAFPPADPRDLPPGTDLLEDAADPNQKYVVRRRVEVAGERLVDAWAGFKDGGQPIVNFKFDTPGSRRFATLTANNIGNRLAIVLDNKVISAPSINSTIAGVGYIEGGGFTPQSTKDLAVLLRAGALPAPLKVIEQRSIGPDLGEDSIKSGTSAAVFGGVLVIVFMVLAYHSFGLFAVVGQIFHIGTLFAVLSLVGGALTLPGIAGVVLSLGMAVDANVLIYERMREEQHSGKSMLNSITSGFSHAYATIIDANLTNLIAAGLMFMLGAGPVRGFALTLFIGLLTSIFSAVMVTRFQVWLWYRSGKRKELPI